MNDKVFGNMIYSGGWAKDEELDFWGKKQCIKIIVSAYENEEPNKDQQDAYSRLKMNLEEISETSLRKLKEYMEHIESEIKIYCDIQVLPEDIFEVVSICNILFLENGNFAILCDAKWDSHGVAILCKGDKVEAGPQDIVWLEG